MVSRSCAFILVDFCVMLASVLVFFSQRCLPENPCPFPIFFPVLPKPPVEPFVTLCVLASLCLYSVLQSRDMRWIYGIAMTSVIIAMTQAMAAP